MATLSATTPSASVLQPVTVSTSMPTNVAANTYDLVTVAGGDIAVLSVKVLIAGTLVTGLTSVAIQTNDTTVTTILTAGEGAVANLLANITLKTFSTSFVLHTTKKIQYTTVGVGLGGSMSVVTTYLPLLGGAVLA